MSMDQSIRKASRHITREINRSGHSAPRIALMLGLGQFALLICIFVKLWIISEGASEAIWTTTALTAAYLLFTFQQVRGQIIATKAIQNIAGKRAYVSFIKKQRSGESFTRLLAIGLAIGCFVALPELALEGASPAEGGIVS